MPEKNTNDVVATNEPIDVVEQVGNLMDPDQSVRLLECLL